MRRSVRLRSRVFVVYAAILVAGLCLATGPIVLWGFLGPGWVFELLGWLLLGAFGYETARVPLRYDFDEHGIAVRRLILSDLRHSWGDALAWQEGRARRVVVWFGGARLLIPLGSLAKSDSEWIRTCLRDRLGAQARNA